MDFIVDTEPKMNKFKKGDRVKVIKLIGEYSPLFKKEVLNKNGTVSLLINNAYADVFVKMDDKSVGQKHFKEEELKKIDKQMIIE